MVLGNFMMTANTQYYGYTSVSLYMNFNLGAWLALLLVVM
jgi:hypothetical protein